MREYLFFFLRCLETAFGVLGLLLVMPKRRKNFFKRCILLVVVTVACCALLMATYMFLTLSVVESIWLPLLVVVMLGGMIAVTTDRWQVLLFNLFSQLSVYLFISYLGNMLSYLLSGRLMEPFYFVFRAVAFVAAIALEYRFVRKPFRQMVEIVHKEWNIATCIAGMFLFLHGMIGSYPMADRPMYKYFLGGMLFILMAIVYYSLYMIVRNAVLRYQKEQTDAVMHLKLSALENQIEMQKLASDNIRRTRHDLRHNCLVAIGKISGGDYNGAIDFLRQFTDHVESYTIKHYCGNHSINCVLSALAERAEGAGISVEIKANVPEKLWAIDEVELASLFANAFENAIEGSKRTGSDSAFIQISADYTDRRMLLSVRNTCTEVKFDDELPISTKPGGGTGTKSIQYIVEKYHGMADFTACGSVFTMQAYLLDE